jgi:hypothetical protein
MDEDTPIVVNMDGHTPGGHEGATRKYSNPDAWEAIQNARQRTFDYHGLSVVETIAEWGPGVMKLMWTRGPIEKTMVPDNKGVLRPSPCVHTDFGKDDQDGIYEEAARRNVKKKFDRFYGLDGGWPEGRSFFYRGVAACE